MLTSLADWQWFERSGEEIRHAVYAREMRVAISRKDGDIDGAIRSVALNQESQRRARPSHFINRFAQSIRAEASEYVLC